METNSKSHVHGVFERIAPKYDFMNDLISFRRHKAWRKFTMKKMNVALGETALDLCCGTCDWTIALANASVTGKVIGFRLWPAQRAGLLAGAAGNETGC
jgi:demethylmenaquinone methyltransferase/2-methoxy-6-polyprenyl-1,4-benzoquinol methylase